MRAPVLICLRRFFLILLAILKASALVLALSKTFPSKEMLNHSEKFGFFIILIMILIYKNFCAIARKKESFFKFFKLSIRQARTYEAIQTLRDLCLSLQLMRDARISS